MSASFTVYLQISYCILIQNVGSQYPSMYGMPSIPEMSVMQGVAGMPGMPQMIPYQSPIQSTQFYNTEFHSNHRHKHKRKSKKNKAHKRHKHTRRDMRSSSESTSTSSESEDTSSDECTCDLTCDQCSTVANNCCESFCSTCVNQGVIFVPFPYPVVMPNQQPKEQEKDKKQDKDNEEKVAKGENSDDEDNDDRRKCGKCAENVTLIPKEELTKNSINTTQSLSRKETDKKAKSCKEDNLESSDEYLHNSENITENSRRTLNGDHITRTLKRRVAKISEKQMNENELDAMIEGLLESPKKPNPSENNFKDIIFKVPNKGSTKYVLTSMRRVKENWLPKYGIVPIPENVATDFMKNLRSLKSIQSLRETRKMVGQLPSKKIVQNTNQEPGTSRNIAAEEANKLPQKLETILVHDNNGSGMTIEGPKSAIQSLNIKILETMQSEKESDSLPIDLVKKIYQY